jgi:hypothetical protein
MSDQVRRLFDPNDRWLYAEECTKEELAQQRPSKPDGYYTCDDCALARKCVLVFDEYNTGNDCLYEK